MDKKEIILYILLNKKCKKTQKRNITTYALNKMKVFVVNKLSSKIDPLIKKKNYRLLSFLVDNYNDMFKINVAHKELK